MSYKGYEILLCERGHKKCVDASCFDENEDFCHCGDPHIWSFSVDQTNDSGVVPVLEVFQEEKKEVCPHCLHEKIVGEKTYAIPKNCGRMKKNTSKVPLINVRFVHLDCPKDGPYDTKKEAWDNFNEVFWCTAGVP